MSDSDLNQMDIQLGGDDNEDAMEDDEVEVDKEEGLITTPSASDSAEQQAQAQAQAAPTNGEQSDSLGEIWFDTMRRKYNDENGSNDTPSSPTNSSEQEQEGSESSSSTTSSMRRKRKTASGTTEQEKKKKARVTSSSSNTEARDNPNSTNANNTNTKQTVRQQSSSTTDNSSDQTDNQEDQADNNADTNHNKTGGYQSDDEGFMHSAYYDDIGSSRSSLTPHGNNRKKRIHHHSHKHHSSKTEKLSPKDTLKEKERDKEKQVHMNQHLTDKEKADQEVTPQKSASSQNQKNEVSSTGISSLTDTNPNNQTKHQQDKQQRQQVRLQQEKKQAETLEGQQSHQKPPTSIQQRPQTAMSTTMSAMTTESEAQQEQQQQQQQSSSDVKKQQSKKKQDNKKKDKKTKQDKEKSTPDQEPSSTPGAELSPKKQRLERNAREKERSGKINHQFDHLKSLLQEAGVVVPKGTKGSVLAIAHHYMVGMKQQAAQQEQAVADLKQQLTAISQGSLGPAAAQAVQYAAQKNGVMEGGSSSSGGSSTTSSMPPPSQAPSTSSQAQQEQAEQQVFDPLTIVQQKDYPQVWDHSPVGIAIATLGGTFLDCNQVFRQVLQCSKTHLREISIFHLLDSNNNGSDIVVEDPASDKGNLQFAFEQISNMLQSIGPSGNSDSGSDNDDSSMTKKPVVLRGSVQGHADLGMAISLVHTSPPSDASNNENDNGNTPNAQRHQHYLCVSLIQHPSTMRSTGMEMPSLADGTLSAASLQPAQPSRIMAAPTTAPQQTQKTPVMVEQQAQPQSMPPAPAAVTAAAATLSSLPNILLNNPVSNSSGSQSNSSPHYLRQGAFANGNASSSLSSSSASASGSSLGLLPAAAGPGMTMMTPGNMGNMTSPFGNYNYGNFSQYNPMQGLDQQQQQTNNNGGNPTKEQQEQEQQQIFGPTDPSRLYTVG